MSRIFVIGHNLPKYATTELNAANYRTWQFVEPLIGDGHNVCLCHNVSNKEEKLKLTAVNGNLIYQGVKYSKFNWRKVIKRVYSDFNPDCVVGVSLFGCYISTFLDFIKPIWMDLYGDPIAENQARMYAKDTHRGLASSIQTEKRVLLAGDVFSTCGSFQKYAVIGKLSHLGRLNKHTFGYDFVYDILPGVFTSGNEKQNDFKILRGKIVDENDFVIFWCGGYNVWTDVETLFEGLELAMKKNPKIKYVSVGRPTVDDRYYEKFLRMINASRYKRNFEIVSGWIPRKDLVKYYRESDVGICIDKKHYETTLGTRTRLVEMLHFGLPVITSKGCELSYILENNKVALTFSIGDSIGLSQVILEAAKDKNGIKKMSILGQKFVRENLSFDRTTKTLRSWAKNPTFAPDHGKNNILRNIENQIRWKARFLRHRFFSIKI